MLHYEAWIIYLRLDFTYNNILLHLFCMLYACKLIPCNFTLIESCLMVHVMLSSLCVFAGWTNLKIWSNNCLDLILVLMLHFVSVKCFNLFWKNKTSHIERKMIFLALSFKVLLALIWFACSSLKREISFSAWVIGDTIISFFIIQYL